MKLGAVSIFLRFGIDLQEGPTIVGRVGIDTGNQTSEGVSVNYKVGAVGYGMIGSLRNPSSSFVPRKLAY